MIILDDGKGYEELISNIMKGYGTHNVGGTNEVIGAKIRVNNTDCVDFINRFGESMNCEEAFKFFEAIDQGKRLKTEHYDTAYYLKYAKAFDKLRKQLTKKGDATRQLVVQFDKMHCFQYIQVLVRDNIEIQCNMRSCNAKSNLLIDMMLCLYFVNNRMFKDSVPTYKNKQINLTMNIGSLHVFR